MDRVAIYCRQSVTRDDEKSASLESQRTELLAHAEKKGWTVVGIYEDANAPASNLKAREDWGRLLLDCEAGKVDIVLAYDASRLWRSVEMKVMMSRTLRESSVKLVATLSDEIPTDRNDDPQTSLMSTIMAAISEYDNDMRSLKIRATHKVNASKGKPVLTRVRPFGLSEHWTTTALADKLTRTRTTDDSKHESYEYVPVTQDRIDREAAIIKEIAHTLINDPDATCNGMARDLNERGILTTEDKQWSSFTVSTMMRNVRLKGVRKHNGNEVPSEYIPAMLDEATFNEVQDALDRLGNGKGRKKSTYELSGMMQCGRCRTTLQAMHNENWYRCPSSSMQSTRGQCGKLKVTGGIAKTAVRDYVVDRLQDGWIDDILKANEAMADEGKVSEAKQELETAQLRKARLKRDFLNGVYEGDEDFYHELRLEINATINRCQKVVDEFTRATVTFGNNSWTSFPLMDWSAWWDQASKTDRRKAIRLCVSEIVVMPVGREWRKATNGSDRVKITPRKINEGVIWELAKLVADNPDWWKPQAYEDWKGDQLRYANQYGSR